MIADLENGPTNRTDSSIRELAEIWNKAQVSFPQGNLNEASRFIEDVLCLEPDHGGASELQSKIKERFDQAEQHYRMITEGLEETDLDTLTGLLEEAVAIYPDHPVGVVPQTRLEARAKQLREALEKTGAAMKKELWKPALEWLKKAQQLDRGNVQIEPTIEALTYIKGIRVEINQALIQNDVSEAQRLARLVDAVVEEMKSSVPVLRE
jgi:tetratricopeptide (TPR) repeat protein